MLQINGQIHDLKSKSRSPACQQQLDIIMAPLSGVFHTKKSSMTTKHFHVYSQKYKMGLLNHEAKIHTATW